MFPLKIELKYLSFNGLLYMIDTQLNTKPI